jgi:hypothetical protein
MGDRGTERRLRKNSRRLRELREELAVIDEQLGHLVDDADDQQMWAILDDNPGAEYEYRQAAGHSEAMADHRRHVLGEIAKLEKKQDELLDDLRLR